MDTVIQTADYIYAIEYELGKSVEEALQRTEDNDYARPFTMDNCKTIQDRYQYLYHYKGH